MIVADLKPYPEYKESGLEWLGEVPRHWSVKRIKTVLRESDCRSADGLGTLLSLTRARGLIPHRDVTDKVHSAKTLRGYKRYNPGQLVMNRMQAWSGMFGASDVEGLVSPDYAVFDVLGGHAIKLVVQRLKTPDLVAQFALESKGIGSGFNRLYTDRFGPIRISLPPPDEQAAIVRFLDWANGRLERSIRAKRKVIALLNEQKQAIIHLAVTRGLDPSVRLKPSGIPWLGDIPRHWQVRPLKQLLVRMDYGTSENVRGDGRVRVLTMGHIRDGKVVLPTKGGLDAVPQELLLEKNDLLFNRTNSPELVGKVGIFTGDAHDEVTFASYLVRLRVRSEHNPIWLNYLLNSTRFWGYAKSQALISLHQANLNSKRYGQMALPVPLKREEQDAVVANIRSQAGEIERSISRLEREIEFLGEYRTRLVADVVTGKLDVQEAAARLPEEAPPDTAEEDADLSDDTQTADEEAVA